MPQGRKASSGAASAATSLAKPKADGAAVDKAFEALKTYDYGASRASLIPIDDAVVACLGDAGAQRVLERKLAEVLKTDVSRVAGEYVCRKLILIGSAQSVPVLAALLADEDLSHWARSTLEHIPGPEAVRALRESLPRLSGLQKTGVVISLGMRRDGKSVSALATLLKDANTQIAGAAATALGNIGTAEAAKVLLKSQPNAPDACLACAERLASMGKKTVALAIYEALARSAQPEHVRLAARRGISMVVGKK